MRWHTATKRELSIFFGGAEDLAARRIRCVGDAGERFTEDALRILRAVRFSAQLGFSIEKKTWQALCELAPSLVHVSKERVQVELTKQLPVRPPGIYLENGGGRTGTVHFKDISGGICGVEKAEKLCKSRVWKKKVCSKDVPAADKDAIKTETVAQQGHMFVKHECETDMAGEFCCCGTSASRKSLALVVFSCPGGRGNLCPGSERTQDGQRHDR